MTRFRLLALSMVTALAVTACGTADQGSSPSTSNGVTNVKVQLQWFFQAQFAGYIAAVEKGFYKEEGLNVELLEGGVDIVPQSVLGQGRADYAVAWVPKALASREQGVQITDVGQFFARSGTYQVAFANKGITSARDLKGKKVGNWGFGNEFELFAGLTEAGLDPGRDVTLVQQQFDMQALLRGDIDAAQAMSYNEYAQVLEATNPATGKLYQPSDFVVIDWNKEGTAMLQDALWANTSRLGDKAYQDTTVKLLTGTIKGWAYCRDNPEECRDLVVRKGSKLGASHQLWQMNEINKLIWPSPAGAGVVDQALWDQTVSVAQSAKNAQGQTVLTKAPEGKAFTNEYVEKALANLKSSGVDVTGENFEPITVKLEPGGA